MSVWGIVLLLAVAADEIFFWVGWRRRQAVDVKCTVDRGGSHKNLFVVISGINSKSELMMENFENLTHALRDSGDVCYVNPHGRFGGDASVYSEQLFVERIVAGVLEWRKHKKDGDIVFVAISKGARPARRAAVRLARAGIRTKVLGIDPALKIGDLCFNLLAGILTMTVILLLPFVHWLLVPFRVPALLFRPTPDDQIADYVKEEVVTSGAKGDATTSGVRVAGNPLLQSLREGNRWAVASKLSFFAFEAASFLVPLPLRRSTAWTGEEDVAIVRSEHDDTVKPEVRPTWEKIVGHPVRQFNVRGAWHSGMPAQPRAYDEPVREALEALGVSP